MDYQFLSQFRFANMLRLDRKRSPLRKGRHIVVAVVQDFQDADRYFIVTAYLSRTVTQGEVIWAQN